MKTIYGRAALTAVSSLKSNAGPEPESAWLEAVASETKSEESRKKCCPKGAFLGLCGAQLLKMVTTSACVPNENGGYAVAAVKLLRRDRRLANDKAALWGQIPGAPVHQNGQMDVVLALWNNGDIKGSR